jgi:hypothetical protein
MLPEEKLKRYKKRIIVYNPKLGIFLDSFNINLKNIKSRQNPPQRRRKIISSMTLSERASP